MITQNKLKELLTYDHEMGLFNWIKRPLNKFKTEHHANTWNSRFSGKSAGHINSTGYFVIKIGGVNYLSHRLAWLYEFGEMPNCIDHVNHNRSDNRIINLRNVSHIENNKNSSMRKDNKSGVVGVYWINKTKSWQPSIRINYKNKYLGNTKDFFEAVCKRKSAEIKFNFHENHGQIL